MKERILLFIKSLGLTPSAFEKSVNLSNGFVSNMGTNVRENTIAKISAVYPNLNINWWKTGEGEMLKNGDLFSNNPKRDLKFISISYSDVAKIIKFQEDHKAIVSELNNRLTTAQAQLSESQKQVSALLELLKTK